MGNYAHLDARPGVPIMLGEWGVGEKAGYLDWKARFFKRVGVRLAHGKFPMLKALIYFDNRYGSAAGDVRIDSSPQGLDSVRKLLNRDVWAPPPSISAAVTTGRTARPQL